MVRVFWRMCAMTYGGVRDFAVRDSLREGNGPNTHCQTGQDVKPRPYCLHLGVGTSNDEKWLTGVAEMFGFGRVGK